MQAILKNKVARLAVPFVVAIAMIAALFPIKANAAIYSPYAENIVYAAYSMMNYPAPSGYCASWVTKVYSAAGFSANGNACDMWAMVANTGSSDINDLQPGMIIATPSCSYEPGSAGWNYGHVGIYVGDGIVLHSTQGWVHTTDVYEWMALYANHADGRPIMWGYSWDVPVEYYDSYYVEDYYEEEYYDSTEDYYYSDEADYTGIFGDGKYSYSGISADGLIYDEGYELSMGLRYYSEEVYNDWLSWGAPYTGYGTAYILDASGNARELVICSQNYGMPGDYIDFYLSNGSVEHVAVLANIEYYSGILAAADDWGFNNLNLVYMANPAYGETYEVQEYLGGAVITGFTVY